ncbi:Lysine-specific histone demethylase 1B [Bagarius yarrelli]|uniref:Lysine-specific histone demethylase 1B n=1 Tax=Bagarius yarrelli TaxID=175774 RepID=A0A556V9Y3_BAGYA|nr:Lysine-specific histone demethylase 1B [Bagarius yarrelli]
MADVEEEEEQAEKKFRKCEKAGCPATYPVQCTKPECGKWRQLTKDIQLTASLAATYRCGMKLNNIKNEGPDQCSQPEDMVRH